MRGCGRAVCALLLASAQAISQESDSVEVRFHRVYLKNGNFIDGGLVGRTDREVVLKVPRGEISIRLDQVERDEEVKMRALRPEASSPPAPREVKGPPEAPKAKVRGPVRVAIPPLEVSAQVRGRVDDLLDRYRRADPDDRYRVMDDLAGAGPGAGAYAASRLEEFPDDLLNLLGVAIRRARDPSSVAVLRALLGSSRDEVRRVATEVLGYLGEEAPEDDLIARLQDPSREVRLTAVEALKGAGSAEAMAPLLARVAEDSDAEVVAKAAEAAQDVAEREDLSNAYKDRLLDLLGQCEGGRKALVVATLGHLAQPDLKDPLEGCLSDESADVRAIAISSLAQLGREVAGEPLLERLSVETEMAPRIALAGAMEKLQFKEAAEKMVPWMDDENLKVRKAVSQSIQHLSGVRHNVDHEQCGKCSRAHNP